ncbi:hypothetical protein [Enhygromyxa salina]|uniref:hypothetical protein n=1 Tax=Enhygromyxa salina TaxID=215803 RepID=UPI000695DA37|nr:hypothetical protein [Enhygromyxa salina]
MTAPPEHEEPLRVGNPVHTGVFAVLFLLTVVGLPLAIRGWAGFIAAPIVGAALWGLYKVTLPGGPKVVGIDTTAGAAGCPACDSMQTDRRPAASPGEPTWECFSCSHRWTPS